MKKQYVIAFLVFGIAIAAVFIVPRFLKSDLRTSLAAVLNTDSKMLVLNLPPAPSRYPGTILLPVGNSYAVFNYSDADHPQMQLGNKFEITAEVKDFSNVKSSPAAGILSGVFSNQQHFTLNIDISEGRIMELSTKDLKAMVNENPSIIKAANERKKPIILQRSYEGVVTYQIKAKDEKGAELLAQVEEEGKTLSKRVPEMTIEATNAKDKSVGLRIDEPVVIAFEGLEVSYVIDNLSSEPELQLTKVTESEVIAFAEINEQIIASKTEASPQVEWGLVVITSGHFENLATLDVPEVIASGTVVEDVLSQYKPKFVKTLVSTLENPITEEKLNNWAIEQNMELFGSTVDYLLVYYAGHALSMPNGELALLMADVNNDYAERVNDIFRLGTTSTDDGIVSAQLLYDHFGVTGIPYTVIMDAC